MRGHRRRRFPGLSTPEVVAALIDRRLRGQRIQRLEWVYIEASGLCWVCRQPVQWDLPDTDPMRPSRDHVIPRSRGGVGLPSNLRLAHARCNTERTATASSVRAVERACKGVA